jgi:hypothetical protein
MSVAFDFWAGVPIGSANSASVHDNLHNAICISPPCRGHSFLHVTNQVASPIKDIGRRNLYTLSALSFKWTTTKGTLRAEGPPVQIFNNGFSPPSHGRRPHESIAREEHEQLDFIDCIEGSAG